MTGLPIIAINERYRGFDIGFAKGTYGHLPAWKSSLEKDWSVGHIYSQYVCEVPLVAAGLIDLQYRIQAIEAWLERKLTEAERKELWSVKPEG